MKLWIKILFVLLLFSLIIPNQKAEARSGCCSHHGGVCGCSCCDGSGLSSTCAPYYPECSGSRVIIPTSKPIQLPTRISTKKPIPTIKPTLKPTLTIKPSPTEVILPTEILSLVPTQPIIPTSARVPQSKSTESQSIFSRFFNWLLKRY